MDDLTLYLIAVIAGAVSVLTPCVLPLLPSILAFSTADGRRRVLGVVLGIEFSFIGLSLLLSGLIEAVGLPQDIYEKLAGVLLVAFGLTMAIPLLHGWFQRATSSIVSRVPQASGGDGLVGGFASGATLGLVWAPCAGPILASVTVAANTDGFSTQTVLIALAYGLGMAGPLTAILLGGRRLGRWLIDKLGGGRRLLAPMGVLLILTGLLIYSGELTRINQQLAVAVNLDSTPTADLEGRILKESRSGGGGSGSASSSGADGELPSRDELERDGYPESDDGQLHDLGPAPDFAGVSTWYNTADGKPLTMESLRGRVVLIDFWTYSCINCLRTLPHIREWAKEYADDGLVIVGVHTPEFAFEKDEGNVADAIEDLKIDYPVATDPDYATWENYYNHYWPAKYLIDRDGQLRFVHYGEGEYDTTEGLIRDLLELDAMPAGSSGGEEVVHTGPRTPETYLGYARANGAQFKAIPEGSERPDVKVDEAATYRAPEPGAADGGLRSSEFAYVGEWTVEHERGVAGEDARLLLHYAGADVFLVIGPPDGGGSGTVTVTDSGPQGKATTLAIDDYKLYDLRETDTPTNGIITLEASPGVSFYAFTFG